METRKLVGGWVHTLGEVVKTPLTLQDDGVCAIGYGQGRVCAIEVPEDDGPIVIHAPLLALAGRSRESIYAKALALNLYGSGTAGCTIALDERNDQLVLCVSRTAASLDLMHDGHIGLGMDKAPGKVSGERAKVPATEARDAIRDAMATL